MSLSVSGAGPRTGRARFMLRGVYRGLLLPLLLLGGVGEAISALLANRRHLGYDFRGGLYVAGRAILHGHDPYRAAYIAHQAAIMRGGGVAVGETARHVFSVPLYPAFANLAVVPLSALPFAVAAALYTVIAVAAMGSALRLLEVRDWRCYGLVLISWPLLWGLILGAIGPFLALGAAAAWRWRARVVGPALAVAVLVALKIFPWTLAVWLALTRRRRACALCVAATALLTFGAWALIGFHGLASYPRMLSQATDIQEGRADSVAALLLWIGASARVAQAVTLLTGVGLLGVAFTLLHRAARVAGGRTADAGRLDADRRAFGLAVIACLAATPIVWDHYMVLLFVPIALLSPRFSRMWTLPVITPLLITLSTALLPDGGAHGTYPRYARNEAIGWLLAEAVLTLWLATTAAQRAGWAAALRDHV